MRQLLSILCTLMFLGLFYNQAEAQSLMQTAKEAEQRAKEARQQEIARYDEIVDSKDPVAYQQYILDFPTGSKTPEIKGRLQEINLWNEAKDRHTVSAYETYLKNSQYHWYESEATHAISVMRERAEREAWDKFRSANTIEAYQQYLSDNPNSIYRQEAEKAIYELRERAAWEKIRYAHEISDIEEIESFVSNYPDAPESPEAVARLHELKGLREYNEGNLDAALSEFSQVDRERLSYSARKAYDDVIEYNEFSKLGLNPSEASLADFMRRYPHSRYLAEVSNRLAIAKARKFGDYATDSDYAKALSYATDPSTREAVYAYISENRQRQKDRISAQKTWQRQQNGGWLNLGLSFLDFGCNLDFEDYSLWYYNVGVILRLGNFKDWAQLAVGVKPGVLGYKEGENTSSFFDDSDGDTHVAFHMPILAQLKLNLFTTSRNSRLFIQGMYQFNAVRVADIESRMAWGAGFGVAWQHLDVSLNYRHDIGSTEDRAYPNQHYLGLSMAFYFRLK